MLAATGDGMGIQAEKLGQHRVAAVAKFERFQTSVQAALLLIQQTVKQDDGCFHFIGRDFQTRGVDHCGNGLAAATREPLPLANDWIDGSVEEQPGDEFTRDSLGLDKLSQSVLHFDVQGVAEFLGKHARGRAVDERFGGGQQRTVAREPSRAVRPQAIGSETGNLTKGVKTAAMRIAGQIVEVLEFPEHGEIDLSAESTLEVGERGDFVTEQ